MANGHQHMAAKRHIRQFQHGGRPRGAPTVIRVQRQSDMQVAVRSDVYFSCDGHPRVQDIRDSPRRKRERDRQTCARTARVRLVPPALPRRVCFVCKGGVGSHVSAPGLGWSCREDCSRTRRERCSAAAAVSLPRRVFFPLGNCTTNLFNEYQYRKWRTCGEEHRRCRATRRWPHTETRNEARCAASGAWLYSEVDLSARRSPGSGQRPPAYGGEAAYQTVSARRSPKGGTDGY